jgi:hypothetical protein
MPTSTRITFALHSVAALVAGFFLLIWPGATLDTIGWAKSEPILTRFFGAALLALAWSSFRGWRAEDWNQVNYLVELEVLFAALASVGIIRHLIIASYPWFVWAILVIFILFTIGWIIALIKK